MQKIKFNSLEDLKKEGKSFYWGSFFLPRKLRNNVATLYSICRYCDNIADHDNKDRSPQLKKLINEIEINKENKVNKFFNENKIDLSIFDDLIKGLITDQSLIRIQNERELVIYSYRVAGTVGLMMAKILNVNDTRSLKGAIDLGIAMQLTNIARDVVEDQKMNRQYIKPNFENIEATLKLADMFYESSFTSMKKIPFKYRFAIIVARRVYRQIGRKIIQKKNIESYEKSGKIYVNNFGKIYQTILSVFDLILLFLKDLESHQRIEEHKIISEEVNLDERI